MSCRSKTRTSLACQPCRNQHLRCDAARPSCSRCRGLSRPCSYPESRRTGNFRAASSVRRATESTPQSLSTCAPGQSSPCADHAGGASRSPRSLEASISASTSISPSTRQAARDDYFLELYYEHFHSSHPFVLPRPALESAINAGHALPSLLHLTTVMRHIGSIYAGTPLDLPVPSEAPDGFSIQATLLLSLTHSMCIAQAAAEQLLARAIEQAKHIGMCSDDFAKATQEFDPVLAESWRRTWWMLYVTHLNYAVIRRDYITNLNGADYDVALPCEEEEYNMKVGDLHCYSIYTPVQKIKRKPRLLLCHASRSKTITTKSSPSKTIVSRLSPTSSARLKCSFRSWETASGLIMSSKQNISLRMTRPL